MSQPHQINFKRLNGYSWSLIVTFIVTMLAMQYHTASFSLEGLFQTLPLIAIMVYWCEKSAYTRDLSKCLH